MGTARVTDLATAPSNREPEAWLIQQDFVIYEPPRVPGRQPESWLIQNEDEFLALVRSFAGRPPRVLVLDTANHRVKFGVGDKKSFAHIKDKRKAGLQWGEFPPCVHCDDWKPKFWLVFAISQDEHIEVRYEHAAPFEDVLRVVLWILRYDEVPEGVLWRTEFLRPVVGDEDVPF